MENYDQDKLFVKRSHHSITGISDSRDPIVVHVVSKRKIIIHDSDSDDTRNTIVRTTTDVLHPKSCTCTRCADICKFLDNTAQHVGTLSPGATGSSESEGSNSFVSSEEEIYTEAEAKVLKSMFPKSVKVIVGKTRKPPSTGFQADTKITRHVIGQTITTHPTFANQQSLGAIGSEPTFELACQLACESQRTHVPSGETPHAAEIVLQNS